MIALHLHRRMRPGVIFLLAATLAALAACGGVQAPSPNAPAPDDSLAGPAGGAVTLWSDSTELFMEHPALIVGEGGVFAVHFTDRTDFAPLGSGRITFRFLPRDGGSDVVVTQETPRAPGIYGPSPTFTQPGIYDLSILVDSPQAKDSLFVPGLRVYATAAEAPRESADAETGIRFLKEQQWKTPDFRMVSAAEGNVPTTIRASGMIEPAAGRYAEVTAPIGGLVDAGGVASSPVPGQRVRRGQVLALLTPTLGESGSIYAAARAELAAATQEQERATRLFAAEAVPERRVHEARIRLTAAREALAGLGGGALTSDGKLAVRSPIDGVVAGRSVTPGGRVAAGALLFTVVDPTVVWATANVPAREAAAIGRGTGATFQLDGGDRLYQTTRMVSVGSVINALSRTVPVIYEVRNTDNSIRVGATASIRVRTGARETGIVIPSSAVLDEDGRSVAYVQLHGEAFERRYLTIGAVEGGRTLVLSGLRAGEFVVSGAPYQVRLASLSTSVPAEGHAH